MTHTFELFSQAFVLASVVVASLITIMRAVDDYRDVWRIRRANRKNGRGK